MIPDKSGVDNRINPPFGTDPLWQMAQRVSILKNPDPLLEARG